MKKLIAIQCVIIAVGLWSMTSERIHLKIIARGDNYTIWMNGRLLAEETTSGYPAGKIGLRLDQVDSAHSVRFSTKIKRQGWGNIEAKDLDTGKILLTGATVKGFIESGRAPQWFVDWRGNFTTDSRTFLYYGDSSWRNYSLDIDLVNGYSGSIAVRVPDGGGGAVLTLRPFNWDFMWAGAYGGQIEVPSGYTAKQIISRIFCSYLIALGVALGSFAVGFAVLFLFSFLDLCGMRRILARPLVFFTNGRGLELARACAVIAIITSLIVFLCLALWVMIECHEKIPHVQDSIVYLFQAKMYSMGHLFVPTPDIIDSVNFEFMVDQGGKWFGKYPPGHPFLLVPWVLMEIPWAGPPIIGTLCVLFIALIAKRLYSYPVALLSGILAFSSPFFLFNSGSYMSHTSCLLAVSICIYMIVRFHEVRRSRYAFLAGLALGWGIMTRPLSAPAVALPWLLWLAAGLLKRGKRLSTLGAVLMAGLGCAIPVVYLLWFNNHLTGDPFLPPYLAYSSLDRPGFGPTIGSFGGHTLSKGILNCEVNLFYLMVTLFGWPHYLTLVLLLIPFILGTRHKGDWLLLGSWLSLAGAYIFFWMRTNGLYDPRFWLEAMPAFLILSARGIASLSQGFLSLARRLTIVLGRSEYVAGWSRVVLIASLLFCLGWLIRDNFQNYFRVESRVHCIYNGIDDRIYKLVRKQDVNNAVVFVVGRGIWQAYGSVFDFNSPRLNSDIIYVKGLDEAKNGLVMERFPGRDYYEADYQRRTLSRISEERVKACLGSAEKAASSG